jgi:hypothetical protein
MGELVSKLSKLENQNQEMVSKTRRLEGDVSKFSDEVNAKNNIIKRL